MASINKVTIIKDPLDVFRDEHAQSLAELDKMARIAKRIQDEGFTVGAFQQILSSVRFIETEMLKHHEKEDHCLFSLLDKHLYESPNSIRHERREMWQKFHELSDVVKDVEDGKIHGTTIHELVDLTIDVAEQFKKHIVRENSIIFPMVKSLLSPAEYESLKVCVANFSSSTDKLG